MKVSKFGRKTPTVIVRKSSAAKTDGAAKKPKQQRTRATGTRVYRDIPFFFMERGDKVFVHSWDPTTNQPNPGIMVPKEMKDKAVQALAKIQLAEQELEQLGATSGHGTSAEDSED